MPDVFPHPGGSLRPVLANVRRYPVFISYGDDGVSMKDRIKRLLEEALNRQLTQGGWPMQLPVVEWRDIAAQRAPAGGRTNDLFVKEARDSSVTIVLLYDQMHRGVREELLAVLDDDEVDLKVFWIRRPRRFERWRGRTEVDQFLGEHRNSLVYREIDDPDSDDAWIAVTANVVQLLLKAIRGHERKPHFEARPEI